MTARRRRGRQSVAIEPSGGVVRVERARAWTVPEAIGYRLGLARTVRPVHDQLAAVDRALVVQRGSEHAAA
ncbi:hypothetical protein [Streptomyces ossamyceticus]|uniref:hypothetical protein n=1 Tax=Streptomyces ossamyceticus TaxID=249581 RepID=UPI0012FE840D|nr:hypothetical protein [Streptomyces ossamyceticus]